MVLHNLNISFFIFDSYFTTKLHILQYLLLLSIYHLLYISSTKVLPIIQNLLLLLLHLHHVGVINRLMIRLFWGQGSMPKATTTGLSSVRGTSSKFTKYGISSALKSNISFHNISPPFMIRKESYYICCERSRRIGCSHSFIL